MTATTTTVIGYRAHANVFLFRTASVYVGASANQHTEHKSRGRGSKHKEIKIANEKKNNIISTISTKVRIKKPK